ncbi:MAG: hypothetical protein KDA79_24645, partial [Planctomycetaceae bacterium]|nr:hypothetical protein [Planctomycetaceae bacterium]
LPGGPRNQGGGGPPAGQPQAAGQLQREIEDFLNQVNRGQKRPAPEAAEPVFDAPRAEQPRRRVEQQPVESAAQAQLEERRARQEQAARRRAAATASAQSASRAPAASLDQSRRDLLQREAKPPSGREQKRPRRVANRKLASSQLGSSLRDHLKEYMGEDHLPQQVRDRLVDEVEAHLGRMANSASSGYSRAEQMKHSLIAALKDPDQVRQAILVHELLTPYSRSRFQSRR